MRRSQRYSPSGAEYFAYLGYDLNGDVIGTHNGQYSYENVVPDSVGESVYNWICNYVNK